MLCLTLASFSKVGFQIDVCVFIPPNTKGKTNFCIVCHPFWHAVCAYLCVLIHCLTDAFQMLTTVQCHDSRWHMTGIYAAL